MDEKEFEVDLWTLEQIQREIREEIDELLQHNISRDTLAYRLRERVREAYVMGWFKQDLS